MMEFTTEKFSGPLGLLLTLIESEEMDITEIALAKIADDYVAYVKQAEDINPEEMADFLVIAAKLLLIKSKALLPYLTSAEDEAEVEDLEKQLRMYKDFAAASLKIKDKLAGKSFAFIPPLAKSRRQAKTAPAFVAPIKVDSALLHGLFLKIIAALAKQQEERLPEARLEPKISIDDKIANIRRLLGEKLKVNFSKLLASATSRTEIIVSFLAVLELAKQQELIFEQDELFSDINLVRPDKVSAPAEESTMNNEQ
jgi:segregation and condensation protein A